MLLLIDSYRKDRFNHVAHKNFTSYGKRSGIAYSSDSIVCTECCRKDRRGFRENGDHFTITKATKVRPSNEGRTRGHTSSESRFGF